MDRRTFTQLAVISPVLQSLFPVAFSQAEEPRSEVAKVDFVLFTHADGPHLPSYIDALAKAPEVAKVFLCDPNGSTLEVVRAGLGARLAGSYKTPAELFSQHKPLVALVAMEGALAPAAIDAALEAGCHVMAEKPACVRPEDFAPLVAKAKAKKLQLMLALINRMDPSMLEARRIVQEGLIGKIYGVELHTIADQTRVKSAGYQKSWMSQKARAGGGHLTWLGIHWLDVAMFITGSKITQVAGFAGNVGGQPIDTEDSAAIVLRFDNGTFGTMTSGYYLDKGKHLFVKIWGSDGWLEINNGTGNPLEWYSTKEAKPEVHRFKPATPSTGNVGFVGHVVRAAQGKEKPMLTPDEGLYVLSVIGSAYEAAASGKTQVVKGEG